MSADPPASLARDLARLRAHYDHLVAEHGDGPAAVQWRDRASQERRMEVLAEVADLREAKVLDLGCGTGHLLTFLRERLGFRGEYVGWDLSPEMISLAAAKHPRARFQVHDVTTQGMPEEFDYALLSGVFSKRVEDNWALLTGVLRAVFPGVRRGLAFNSLSTYVDYQDPDLAYFAPEDVLRFCKTDLASRVVLRHEYSVRPGAIPFEFTLYVYRQEVGPRA